MSGNWSLAATETTGNGNGPLTTLNGSISEQTATTPSDYVTAVFQVSSGCFGNAAVVPLSGSVTQLQFQVISFGINAQFLTINTTKKCGCDVDERDVFDRWRVLEWADGDGHRCPLHAFDWGL